MADVTQWSDKIEQVIRKFAYDAPEETKEDLRQECFLILLEADHVDGPGHAYTIAANKVLEKLGRKRRVEQGEISITVPEVMHAAEDAMPSDLDLALRALAVDELIHALARLPEDEERVISLSFGVGRESMSELEIRKTLGKSKHWVRTKKQTAIRKLRVLLGVEES